MGRRRTIFCEYLVDKKYFLLKTIYILSKNICNVIRKWIFRQLLFQKAWNFDKEIHALFIDFKKTYDSNYRTSLIKSLKEFNLPQKLISLTKISITETFVKIKEGAVETEPILVKSGLRQGDSIIILFNLILEKVVSEMNIQLQEGFKLQESIVASLAYAEYVV